MCASVGEEEVVGGEVVVRGVEVIVVVLVSGSFTCGLLADFVLLARDRNLP